MEEATTEWTRETGTGVRMCYLGDTEDVQIHEQVERDIDSGALRFGVLVSTRFDLFCSRKYLLGNRDDLQPCGGVLPVRDEITSVGVADPFGLFHPLVVLPHYIVWNSEVLGDRRSSLSLEELLDPYWAGRVVVGNTDLPSGQSVLFTMWFLFGEERLETCVRNWRQKSAPSAVRHGLLKSELPIGLLPAVFAGPGPSGQLSTIKPDEGLPLLPSFVAAGIGADDPVSFVSRSVGASPFMKFYRDMAHAIVADPTVPLPATADANDTLLFPDWAWIVERDMDHFRDTVRRVPMV